MKAFLSATLTLCLLVCSFFVYAHALTRFSDTLIERLDSLPKTPEACEEAGEDVPQLLEQTLEDFCKKELFIHLAFPYERMESAHEKLILLKEYYAAGAYADFCATRALCLEEMEILRNYEMIRLPNLI